jgi:hypothetical protein
VCPVLHPSDVQEPLEVLAARSDEYMSASSSGGVFPELARRVLDDGGVVFGSVVNDDMTVGHTDAEDMAAVERMRGSKYVQSDLYGTFEEAKYYLEEVPAIYLLKNNVVVAKNINDIDLEEILILITQPENK